MSFQPVMANEFDLPKRKVSEMKCSILSFDSTASASKTGTVNSSENSSLLDLSDSQEVPLPAVQLNLMQLMKQRGSFAKFRVQTKEKRRLYESESN